MRYRLYNRKNLVCIAVGICTVFSFAAISVCAQEIDDCMECHMDATLTKKSSDGSERSLYVDKKLFLKSVHGEAGYTCVDCHEDAQVDKHPKEGLVDIKCADCHDEVNEVYAKSNHGQLNARGTNNAPYCYDCHSMHAVLPASDPDSAVNTANLAVTCGKCHEDEAAPALPFLIRNFIQDKQDTAYPGLITAAASIIPTRLKGHGKVDMACEYNTQKCSNCHFEVMNHGNDELKPQICSNCHTTERSTFAFGKIHKYNIMKTPLLSILTILLYVAGIAGLVFFFKKGLSVKKEAKEASGDE
ncbi:MAG: hypothetical protein GY868_20725 [Deltaproteobacteria bacterium]|nr:hypothetical protein [Deltaproteobacteria bacterium]